MENNELMDLANNINTNVEVKEDLKETSSINPYTKDKESKATMEGYLKFDHAYVTTASKKDVEELEDKLSKLNATDIDKKTEESLGMAFHSTIQASEVGNDVTARDSLTNNVSIGEEILGVNNVKFNRPTSNTNLNVLQFKALLNLGSPVKVTLYHSGFTILLTPPSNLELNALDLKVQHAQLEIARETLGYISEFLGRETTGLLTSNNKYFTIHLLKDFILEHISSYSLDVPKEQLFEHISMLDLNAILLGLIHACNGNKLPVKRFCSNLYKVVNNKPACTAVFEATLDPSKLLFVDRNIFKQNPRMLQILSRTKEKSVSLEDIEEYKNTFIEYMKQKYNLAPITLPASPIISVDLEIKLKIPSVEKYLESSVLPLEKIAAELQTIDLGTDIKVRKEKVNSMAENVYLVSLISNIEYIGSRSEDGELIKLTDDSEMVAFLEKITESGEHVKIIEDAIIKFFGINTISLVATPRFICPVCKDTQAEQASNAPAFEKDLIPLEMVHFFFYLITQKILRGVAARRKQS